MAPVLQLNLLFASPARALLFSEIIVQPDSQANVNICGFKHTLHDFVDASTSVTGIANAISTGHGTILFSLQSTAGTTVTFRLPCLYMPGFNGVLLTTGLLATDTMQCSFLQKCKSQGGDSIITPAGECYYSHCTGRQ